MVCVELDVSPLLQEANKQRAITIVTIKNLFILSLLFYDFIPVRVMDLTSCFSKMTNSTRTGSMAMTAAAIIT